MEKTAQIEENITPDVEDILEKTAESSPENRLDALDRDVRKVLIEHVFESE